MEALHGNAKAQYRYGVASAFVPVGCKIGSSVSSPTAKKSEFGRHYVSNMRSGTVRPRFFSTWARPGLIVKTLPKCSRSLRTARAAVEPLVLTEENIQVALDEVKEKLGSMFGNSSDNRNVGITGDVELASIDGPIVVIRLKGRFWHKRADVLARVSAYLMERIPEICDIEIEDAQQLDDSHPDNT